MSKIIYELHYMWGMSNEITHQEQSCYEIERIINFIYEKFKIKPKSIKVLIGEEVK